MEADLPDENSLFDIELDDRERQLIRDVGEIVLTSLSLVFVGLLVVEYTVELSAAWNRRLQLVGYVIWAIFALEFVTRFTFADEKRLFLRSNWLTGVAAVLPLFRVFRAVRAVRAVRSLRLVRLVTGANRGMGALRRTLGAGGVGYVLTLTLMVVLLAGSGMYSLEHNEPGSSIDSWTEGLWWSATTVVTLGSADYPATSEGRILSVLVMIYGLAVSGYVTAVLAVFLLGRRGGVAQGPRDGLGLELRALRDEVRALREQRQ